MSNPPPFRELQNSLETAGKQDWTIPFTAEPKKDAAMFSAVLMDSLRLEVEISLQNAL